MSVTLQVSDVNLTIGAFATNFGGPDRGAAGLTAGLLGNVKFGNCLLYTSTDGKIHKFECATKSLIGSVSVPSAHFGFAGATQGSNIDGDQFVLFDPANSIFQLWDGRTLTKLHDYWTTFSSVVLANRGSVVWNQALDSLWTVEGASSPYHVVRYRLTAGTRTVVSGITVTAPSSPSPTGVRLAIDPLGRRVIFADGTNFGTIDVSSDALTTSAALSTILTCGAAWNAIDVDPEGYLWLTCVGFNFSGHVWKVDPISLGSVGSCGHHNGGLDIHIDATGIPTANSNASQFAFEDIGTETMALIGGNGYWELALVDRESVSILWNAATTPPLTANGTGLDAGIDGTCGVVADSGGALWAFVNPASTASTLYITEIGISVGGFAAIGHGVNCNDYDPVAESQGSTTAPGNGVLIDDLEPMRAWCRANGISVALNQDSQRSAKDLLDELFTIGNSAPVFSGDRLKVIPYDEVSAAGNGAVYVAPTAAGPIADLTDQDFVSDGKTPPIVFKRKRRADCDNVVAIEYVDRTLDYSHNSVSECDQRAVALYGPRKGGTLAAAELGVNVPSGSKSLLAIHKSEVAQAIGSILAKRSAAGAKLAEFTLKAEWMGLESMDLVTVTDQRSGVDKLPMRLVTVKENAKRELQCVAGRFIYGLNHPSLQAIPGATGTLVVANVDPGLVNAPVIFQPTPAMLGANGSPELWFLVSGADPNYGGCIVSVSVDGGVSYGQPLGSIGPATTGDLTATFADHADPDNADTLAVDLTESGGELTTQSTDVADGFADPCYLEGVDAYTWEVICYTVVALTSAEHYSLSSHIRRACLGTAHASHASGKRFAAIDGSVFRVPLPAAWIGVTLYFKFQAFNKLGGQLNDIADCVPYTYTPQAVFLPGGFYVNGS